MIPAAIFGIMLAGSVSIGDPAPSLEPATFLRGEAVARWAPGTAYIVEFSGTRCGPCAAFLPKLAGLQAAHPDLVVISIYSGEGEDEVRKYIDANRAKLGFRVAADPDQVAFGRWAATNGLYGIPYAFVVDKAGRVAWVGNPEADRLVEAVPKILAGTFDPRADAIPLRFKQAIRSRIEVAEQRRALRDEASERIRELLDARKWAEAIAASEAGGRDLPEFAAYFRSYKIHTLACDPATLDRAVDLALDEAARQAASRESDPAGRMVDVMKTLLNADERGRDRRLLDLAVEVAGRGLKMAGRDVAEGAQARPTLHYFRAEALARLGRPAEAAADVREALAAMDGATPPGADAAERRRQTAGIVARWRARLAELERAAAR